MNDTTADEPDTTRREDTAPSDTPPPDTPPTELSDAAHSDADSQAQRNIDDESPG
jgi:hypothetical protein